MSTPDQPDATPLTRRRLREIRATGANPVITPAEQAAAAEAAAAEQEAAEAAAAQAEAEAAEGVDVDAAPAAEAEEHSEPEAEAPEVEADAPESPAPFARPAEPAVIAAPPVPDAAVDLGVAPLTRRQARAQERIRTASVPVIQPDAIPGPSETVVPAVAEPVAVDPVAAEPVAADPVAAEIDAEIEAAETDVDSEEPAGADLAEILPDATEDESDQEPLVVNPELGSELLSGQTPPVTLPASFDSLIARGSSSTGSIATPNALILSQSPTAAPLGPLTATGEVLITGSFDLPAGFGSAGSAHGTTDGKEIDATLIDGELPPASSPTPIAASAAISTARHSGEEIIRPPAPEKGNKLMLALVITAGVLALAVVGVLIFAVTTGVF